MDNEDLDDEDYEGMIVGSSEDDEEEARDPKVIEEYRRKLLGSLSQSKEGNGDISSVFRKRDL